VAVRNAIRCLTSLAIWPRLVFCWKRYAATGQNSFAGTVRTWEYLLDLHDWIEETDDLIADFELDASMGA
jgi:hypothetical protein